MVRCLSEREISKEFLPDRRDVVTIIAEMGFRPYKELLPMRKEHVDLEKPACPDPGFEDPERRRRHAHDGQGVGC